MSPKPYFSHDEGARNDPKLVRVLMRLGQAGKGVYWDLVEMLHEQGGYLPLGDLESMAFGLRTDLALLTSLLNDFGLFSQDSERFWSETALDRLQMRNAKAEARAAAGAKGGKAKAEKLALLQQQASIASEEPSNAMALPAETLASKVKESKEKEILPLPSVEVAPQPEKKEGPDQPSDNPKRPASHTGGGAADVGTRKEPLKASRGGKWQAPGEDEVLDYFREKRPQNLPAAYAESVRFMAYYQSNGWKVGRNPMQDWRAAVRNWLTKVPEVGGTTLGQGNALAVPAFRQPAPSQVSQRQSVAAAARAKLFGQ